MPDPSNGRFTTDFNSISAGEVHVPRLPLGCAGSRGIGSALLSSIAAIFHISPDTARILRPATLSIGLSPDREEKLQYLRAPSYSGRSAELLSSGD